MELPRGMKDFETEELSGIELVRERFVQTARLFAFQLMEPSPIESLSTLEAKSGPAIRKEIYHFRDKGDRDVALRFDFTVGLARYVSSRQSLRLPAKLGSFGGVFRYDEPQKGRYRFFHQWNVEIFGRPGIESEAEIIEFASRLYGSLGLDGVSIHISHRRLAESFIRNSYPHAGQGMQGEVFADSLRLVDKAAKKSLGDLLKEYGHLPGEFVRGLLDFASIRGTPEEVEARIDTGTLDSWDYLVELWDSLQNRSVKNILIDFGVVRGLDYYSGTVFEAFDEKSKFGALAGGGRYDSLMGAFGRPEMGAAGMAGGVERTLLAMGERAADGRGAAPDVFVLYANGQMQRHAARLASQLRARGVPVGIDLAGRQLKKQIESASGARLVIIVGQRELAEGKVVLRNMADGTESQVGIDGLLDDPSGLL